MIIPLEPGRPHFRFSVELDGINFGLRLDWLTRYEYYVVNISVDGETVAAGRALHPEMNLLDGLDLGTMELRGSPATPDNLGRANRLVYEA